jgi:hypothetical protein
VALTILKDWEVNMAEYKLQVLFENEKENTTFHSLYLEEVFLCTLRFNVAITTYLILCSKQILHMYFNYGRHRSHSYTCMFWCDIQFC